MTESDADDEAWLAEVRARRAERNKPKPLPTSIEEHIRRVVAAAPPITPEQAAKLRVLLAPKDSRDARTN